MIMIIINITVTVITLLHYYHHYYVRCVSVGGRGVEGLYSEMYFKCLLTWKPTIRLLKFHTDTSLPIMSWQ